MGPSRAFAYCTLGQYAEPSLLVAFKTREN